MRVENYDALYIPSKCPKDGEMVWCSKHWVQVYDMPFGKSEKLVNCSIIWFDSLSEFELFPKKNHPDIFDISFEFDNPSMLVKTILLQNAIFFASNPLSC